MSAAGPCKIAGMQAAYRGSSGDSRSVWVQ